MFYNDSLPVSRLGESGLVPDYSLVNDSYVALAFVFSIVLSLVITNKSWRLVCFQARNLFRMPRENSIELRETADEMRYQTYFCLQGVMLLGLLAYSATIEYYGSDLRYGPYVSMGLFAVAFAVYYIVREMLLLLVSSVFFTKAERHLDNVSRLFIMAVQGAALLPVALLHTYLQLPALTTIKIVAALYGLMFMLHFYKSWNIFFRKKNAFVQFFLYLCTLEAVPLALLGGAILFIANYLKVII